MVVYSAPEAVMDKIAKMRSLGSLQAWGAITKVISASVFAQLSLCGCLCRCPSRALLPPKRTRTRSRSLSRTPTHALTHLHAHALAFPQACAHTNTRSVSPSTECERLSRAQSRRAA